jgi:hypothetical protein
MPGFAMIEALVALLVLGGTLAVVLPPLAQSLRAKGEGEAGLSAGMAAQSLLDAHAPPGATREGRWQGRAPEGDWRVDVGHGEAGAGGVALRPVRVALGDLVLHTLRPGPVEDTIR